jgi:Tol biopolymer transport system component
MALAFVADWDGDNEIFIVQTDNSDLIQVTQNSSGDIGPVWSPDGDQIASVITRYTNPRLYITDTDSLQGVIVAPNLEVSSLDLVWSPLGDTIVFRSFDDLYAFDVETSEVVNLTQNESFSPGTPSFSPDGSKMVFHVNMLQGTPRHRMFTVRVDGTELKELSFPQGDVFRPTWHPIKNEILFEGVVENDGIGLYVASLDGAIRKLPLEPEYRAPEPAWSPDGSMVGYIVRLSDFDSSGERLSLHSLHIATIAGDVDLVVLNPTGEPDAGLTISAFFWAPDSRHIAYTIPSEVGGSGEVDLYVLNICDGTSSLIVEAIDAFSTPSWTAERPPIAAVTPTESEFDFTDMVDKWLTYRNETYGFSFEYPAVYAEGPYAYCDVREIPIEDGVMITIGMRSDLYVFAAHGQTVEDYVDSTIEDRQSGDPDWELTNRKTTTQAGVEAISIDYRFGSLSRFGSAKIFKRGEELYVFNITFGAFCDVPEINFYEWDAYPRMVSSFKWLDE